MTGKEKEKFMKKAYLLARKGWGKTSPNPVVGAVLVKNGQIIGEGYHKKAGLAHAEVEALKVAGEQTKGSELFVTLEPCCVYGRTPPCTEAIIKSGIKKVYIGTFDPNPKVQGRGVEILRQNGIDVEVGFLEKKLQELNEAYVKHITTGLPFVILKNALSVNGKIGFKGERTTLSGGESLKFVHRLRAYCDAVLVGVNTVLTDDPLLTPRYPKPYSLNKRWIRVILDSTGRTPLNSRLARTSKEVETWLATTEKIPAKKAKKLEEAGFKVKFFPGENKDNVSLKEVLKALGKEGITSVLVEGGSAINCSFFNESLWDKAVFILTPYALYSRSALDLICSESQEKVKARLQLHKVQKFGVDLVLTFYPFNNSQDGNFLNEQRQGKGNVYWAN